jgi:5-methylcytosine-specific restriction endonuclease McrA
MDFIVLFIFLALLYSFITRNSQTGEVAETEHSQLITFRKTKKYYLQSEVWQKTRKKILNRDNFTCQSCGAKDTQLHVHHLSDYDKLGNERHEKLITLCPDCHEIQHEVYGYPSTYSEYMKWNVKLIKLRTVK